MKKNLKLLISSVMIILSFSVSQAIYGMETTTPTDEDIPVSDNRPIYILSIDGGGIRGLVPAIILDYIETELNRQCGSEVRLSEVFDFFAGTSTGGIIALGLNIPIEQNVTIVKRYEDGSFRSHVEVRPKRSQYEAGEFRRVYEEDGPKIFSEEMKTSFGTGTVMKGLDAEGILANRYSSKNLESILKHYFKDLEIKSSVKPVFVTAYEVGAEFTPHSLASYHNGTKSILMREAARATSAAPTFFKPASITLPTGTTRMVDGGVFANNPSLVAFHEVDDLFHNDEKKRIFLISLGTGANKKRLENNANLSGFAQWRKTLIDIMLDGPSELHHLTLEKILNLNREEKTYFRFQTPLKIENMDMDNVTSENIAALISQTCEAIEKIFQTEIGKILFSLKKNYGELLSASQQERKKRAEETYASLERFMSSPIRSTSIDLSSQEITDEMFFEIINYLSSCHDLQKINLRSNNITKDGILIFHKFLLGNAQSFANLKEIDLKHNQVGNMGARELLNLLKIRPNLNINLQANNISLKISSEIKEKSNNHIIVD